MAFLKSQALPRLPAISQLAHPPLFPLNLSMKFAIYHRMRESARELDHPKLSEVEAPTKDEAERLTAHLSETGTWAVAIPPTKTLATTPCSTPTLAHRLAH